MEKALAKVYGPGYIIKKSRLIPCMRWDMRCEKPVLKTHSYEHYTTFCIRTVAYEYYLYETELAGSQDAQKALRLFDPAV